MFFQPESSNLSDVNKTTKNIVLGEVLPHILDELRTADLVNCRLVNQTWNKETIHILRRRRDLRIPTIFCCEQDETEPVDPVSYIRLLYRPGPCYYWYPHAKSIVEGSRDGEKMTLTDFTSLLLKSKSDPPILVRRLEFDCYTCPRPLVQLPEVCRFLTAYGGHITELRLTNYVDNYLGQNGWTSTSSRILKYTPNLETLLVVVVDPRVGPPWDRPAVTPRVNYHIDLDFEDQENGPTFPRLNVIELFGMEGRRPLSFADVQLAKVVKMAPLLQSIRFRHINFPLPMATVLSNVQKLHLIKMEGMELELFHLFENNLEDLKHLENLTSSIMELDMETLFISTNFSTFSDLTDYDQNEGCVRPKMQLTHNWGRMLVCLIKILEKSQRALRTLWIQNAAIYLWSNPRTVGLLPRLPNVSTLSVVWRDLGFFTDQYARRYFHLPNPGDPPEDRSTYDYIPRALWEIFSATWASSSSSTENCSIETTGIATMFPGLETLEIVWGWAHFIWFPFWDEIFPTVKNLRISTMHYPVENMHLITTKLPAMFPSLQSFHTTVPIRSACFSRNFQQILKLETLHHLSIQVVWTRSGRERRRNKRKAHRKEIFTMATLLGIRHKIWQRTFQRWEKNSGIDWSIIKGDLSSRPSVFSFTGLHRLVLKFEAFDEKLCVFFVGCIGQLATVKKIPDFQVHLNFCGGLDDKWQKNAESKKVFDALSQRFPKVQVKLESIM